MVPRNSCGRTDTKLRLYSCTPATKNRYKAKNGVLWGFRLTSTIYGVQIFGLGGVHGGNPLNLLGDERRFYSSATTNGSSLALQRSKAFWLPSGPTLPETKRDGIVGPDNPSCTKPFLFVWRRHTLWPTTFHRHSVSARLFNSISLQNLSALFHFSIFVDFSKIYSIFFRFWSAALYKIGESRKKSL